MDERFASPYPSRVGPTFVNDPILTGTLYVFDSD